MTSASQDPDKICSIFTGLKKLCGKNGVWLPNQFFLLTVTFHHTCSFESLKINICSTLEVFQQVEVGITQEALATMTGTPRSPTPGMGSSHTIALAI